MKLIVTLEARPDPIEVEVMNADRVRWDLHAVRKGWPTFDKVPFLGMTFLAWAALKRIGQTSATWDDFSTRECIDVTADDDDLEDTNEDTNELGKFTETAY